MKEQDPNTGWTRVTLIGLSEDNKVQFEAEMVVERPTALLANDEEAFKNAIQKLLEENIPDDYEGQGGGIVNLTPIPAMPVH